MEKARTRSEVRRDSEVGRNKSVLRRIGEGSLKLGAGTALAFGLAGCGSADAEPVNSTPTPEASSSSPVPTLEATEPTGAPESTELSFEERVERINKGNELDRSTYQVHIGDEVYTGVDNAVDNLSLTFDELPVTDQAGREDLAEGFMDLAYDTIINGGLTEEEFAEHNTPDSIMLPTGEEGIQAIKGLVYDPVFKRTLNLNTNNEWINPNNPDGLMGMLGSMHDGQRALFESTLDSASPATASYEIVGVGNLNNLIEEAGVKEGEPRMESLVISFNHLDGTGQSELMAIEVVFQQGEDELGNQAWTVLGASRAAIVGDIRTNN